MGLNKKNNFLKKILTIAFVVVVCFGFLGIKKVSAAPTPAYTNPRGVQVYKVPGSGEYIASFPDTGKTVDLQTTDYQTSIQNVNSFKSDGNGNWTSTKSSFSNWSAISDAFKVLTGQTLGKNTVNTNNTTVNSNGVTQSQTTSGGASYGLGFSCFTGLSAMPTAIANDLGIIASGIPCIFSWAIANAIIVISSGFMYITSIVFNGIITYSIVNLSCHIGQASGSNCAGVNSLYPVILSSWKTFRDVGNIFFIFILLYIAISTILRLSGPDTKKLLTSVIIVALLVNFSMFFAEVIIDSSNILALTFLSKITVTGTSGSGSLLGASSSLDGGLASAYIKNLGLGSFFGAPGQTTNTVNSGSSGIPGLTSANWLSVLLVSLLTAVVLFIVGFVLFISSILFLIRFVVFIFLLIVSPLAFVGSILPKTKSMISDKWWKTLFDQALFAPIYFMLSWATISIMNGVSDSNNTISHSIWDLFQPGAASAVVDILIKFLIIIVMLITTLIISKSMASSGGGAVKGAVDWASGKAGGLYGRTAARVTTRAFTGGTMGLQDVDKKFSESKFGNTGFGRSLRNVTTGAAMTAKFGDKQSLADIRKTEKTANDKYAKHVDENIDKNYEKEHLNTQRQNEITRLNSTLTTTSTTEEVARVNAQVAEIRDRQARKAPLTAAEKSTTHYRNHLREQAEKLEGKHPWLHSTARKAAAKHVRDKWRGKQSSAEELLNSWAAAGGATAPATPPAPGGAPHTP